MENEIVRWVLSYIAFRIHKFVNLQYSCTIMVNYSITDTFGGLLTGNMCRKTYFSKNLKITKMTLLQSSILKYYIVQNPKLAP